MKPKIREYLKHRAIKKIILTSATVLCIGFTASAQDTGRCNRKCETRLVQQEYFKIADNKKYSKGELAASAKCNKYNSNCKTNEKKKGEKTSHAK